MPNEEIRNENEELEVIEVEDQDTDLVEVEDEEETEEIDSKVGYAILAGAGIAAGYGVYRFTKDVAVPGVKKAASFVAGKLPFQLKKKKPKVDVVDNETGEKVVDVDGYEEEIVEEEKAKEEA